MGPCFYSRPEPYGGPFGFGPEPCRGLDPYESVCQSICLIPSAYWSPFLVIQLWMRELDGRVLTVGYRRKVEEVVFLLCVADAQEALRSSWSKLDPAVSVKPVGACVSDWVEARSFATRVYLSCWRTLRPCDVNREP